MDLIATGDNANAQLIVHPIMNLSVEPTAELITTTVGWCNKHATTTKSLKFNPKVKKPVWTVIIFSTVIIKIWIQNCSPIFLGKCPHPHHTCQKSEDLCECPQGVLDPSCTDCQPGFWAYTSFGCLDCGCSVMGSEKGKCDAYIGKCQCKPGFSGDKCEICPDGSQATLDGCLNRKCKKKIKEGKKIGVCSTKILIFPGSTKYAEPITCGLNSCDFGATCSGSHCLCEIDCSSKIFYKLPVCGNDGNTYRSECQLRQYSCRIQKEITITKYEPCTGM